MNATPPETEHADPIRRVLVEAVAAGRYGAPPKAELASAILAGDAALELDALRFDSLAWMEFCILVELRTGQELTPDDIAAMSRFGEVEAWLRSRLGEWSPT